MDTSASRLSSDLRWSRRVALILAVAATYPCGCTAVASSPTTDALIDSGGSADPSDDPMGGTGGGPGYVSVDAKVRESGTAPTSCPIGRRLCGDTCVDASTDRDHCGGCSRPCREGMSCVGGVCECPAGTTVCGATSGTWCFDTSKDSLHCGRCERQCVGGETCAVGVCGCPAGTTKCGATCVDTMKDADHCGRCGRPCPSGESCDGGVCSCPTTRTVCGGKCVDSSKDPGHCGGCDRPCSLGKVCAGGICACPPGEVICGGKCVDTRSDAKNCGGCGKACSGDDRCMGGGCKRECYSPGAETPAWCAPGEKCCWIIIAHLKRMGCYETKCPSCP